MRALQGRQAGRNHLYWRFEQPEMSLKEFLHPTEIPASKIDEAEVNVLPAKHKFKLANKNTLSSVMLAFNLRF
jgi:hypothetical protein